MRLTTLDRFKALYNITGTPEDPDTRNDVSISRAIDAVSRVVESHLKRNVKLQEYWETFHTPIGQSRFSLLGYPVTEITSVEFDASGRFDGGETELPSSSYSLDPDGKTLILPSSLIPAGSMMAPVVSSRSSIRVRYTGGLAPSPDRSVFTLSDAISGDPDSSSYIIGTVSGAKATYVSHEANAEDPLVDDIVVANVQGIFEEGEELVLDLDTPESFTLSAIVSQSLAEVAPEIVYATELQARYYVDHQSDFENASTDSAQVSRRSSDDRSALLPEVVLLLEDHINHAYGSRRRHRR